MRHPEMRLVVPIGPGWLETAQATPAGANVVVLVDDGFAVPEVSIMGRTSGLLLRDTLLILRPGPRASYALLFRRSLSESSTTEQVAQTGYGALNINGSRSDRWPSNVVLLHDAGCQLVGKKRLDQRTPSKEPTQSKRTRPALGYYEPGTRRQRVLAFESLNVPHFGYGDEDGFEHVDDWECEKQCPVKLLEAGGTGQSRYYLQFMSEEGLHGWLANLVAPLPLSA